MSQERARTRNPFQDLLVTELIENFTQYRQMFSEKILVGETLEVFQASNVVLSGPLGSGKSMLLNLVRYPVIARWISDSGTPPTPIKLLPAFFGISINLTRVGVSAFGRRSVAKSFGRDDEFYDASAAADFINHYLFREFTSGLKFLREAKGRSLREWLQIDRECLSDDWIFPKLSKWSAWFDYYRGAKTLEELSERCTARLEVWRSFLNANIDKVPDSVWSTKSSDTVPLHEMGNLLELLGGGGGKKLPLFVVIDQYEELPKLNRPFGIVLQRIVNTLVKARDPVVFYKIGARTYDWGKELRVWGSDSPIEVRRDYVVVDLGDVLMRKENSNGWLFPKLATDVAYRRLTVQGHFKVRRSQIEDMLGPWSPEKEAGLYFRNKNRRVAVIPKISESVRGRIIAICGKHASPLQLRLASAWAIEQIQKRVPESVILSKLSGRPWSRQWWAKERKEIALIQIASFANQKRLYFGWNTVLYLSGANISAFLMICSEIWDSATRMDVSPLRRKALPYRVQSDGIWNASKNWYERDKIENAGGTRRYQVVNNLGSAIGDFVVRDLGISNPGHTGFSLRETDLFNSQEGQQVALFLNEAVSWAVFEERRHKSKQREGAARRKWYLHPLISPTFSVPFRRVKEPFYAAIDQVSQWLKATGQIRFGKEKNISAAKVQPPAQQSLWQPKEGA